MASAIEAGYDANGIIWPVSIAPFEVIVTSLNPEDAQVSEISEKIYGQLQKAGVDVLIDDRAERAGVKFKDADLLGVPVRITIGKKGIAEGVVEIKLRSESENRKVAVEQVCEEAARIVNELKRKFNVAD